MLCFSYDKTNQDDCSWVSKRFLKICFADDTQKKNDKKKTPKKKKEKENTPPSDEITVIDDKPSPKRSVSSVLGLYLNMYNLI